MPFKKGHTLWNHPNCKKSQFKCGEAHHTVPHSEESKVKMSESRKGKTLGSSNPSWKGGVTPFLVKLKRLTEYKTWQKNVFIRDNYTCRSCSARGSKTLTAHHLVSFSFVVQMLRVRSVDEAREQIMLWNIRNGVTLCEDCHKKTSNYAWRASKKPRDKALYKIALLFLIFLTPVLSHAATFGYTSIGGTSGSISTDDIYGTSFTAPSDVSTVESVSIYSKGDFGTNNVRAIITLVSTKNIVTNGIGNGVSVTTSASWYTSTMPTPPTLSPSTNYWLGGIAQTVYRYMYYDVASATYYVDTTNSYASPSNPTDATSGTRTYSIYATYTASGGSSPAPIPSDPIWFN